MMLKKLKLNGTVYKIEVEERLLDASKTQLLQGYCVPDKSVIKVSKDHPDPYRTLLHEAMHAICIEYNLQLQQEETVVMAFEAGVTSLLRNNPQFVKELMKGNK